MVPAPGGVAQGVPGDWPRLPVSRQLEDVFVGMVAEFCEGKHMLTRKQYELLVFIDQRLKEAGVSPSFDEMKDALGLRSKSGIHRLITGLEERGFIRRLPHRARALEVLRLPENMAGIPVEAKEKVSPGGFSPNVIQGDFKLSGAPAAAESEAVQLPLWGRIAAGTPIEALRDHTNSVSIPASMLGKGEHYALDVDGDSMVDAGILDGDTVIIRRCETAENGSIVVALVDNTEVTLKRLRRKGDSIALEPANVAYETRIFGPDRVKLQGCLVGLLRKY
jgi:repressor LexA